MHKTLASLLNDGDGNRFKSTQDQGGTGTVGAMAWIGWRNASNLFIGLLQSPECLDRMEE